MSSISLIFRKDKINLKGAAPIHFRLIKDRKVSYISSSITIPVEMWDDSKNRVKAKHPNSARLNSFLSNKFTELQDKFFEFETNNKGFTNKTLKENVQGKKSANFFEFCNTVLAQFEADKKIGTYFKNKSIVEKLKTYIKNDYLSFYDITPVFLNKYETYLKKELNNKINTVGKDLRFIRAVYNKAISQDVVEYSHNPFIKFKIKSEKTQRCYLSEEELLKVENLELTFGTRMCLHRDMFVFSAYTGGLRVSDILLLKWKDFDGTHINFKIKKTNSQLSIKLPNRSLSIIEKYIDKVDNNPKNYIFPMLNNQLNEDDPYKLDNALSSASAYINKNLQMIEDKLELEKHISFHTSRHTFATRALKKGMSIDKVSKLLGHAQIKETQIYAKIINTELDKAMDIFND